MESGEEVTQGAIGHIEWIVTVADTIPKPWPPAWMLLKCGMPNLMVQRYRRVRYDMTVGLRRRAQQNQN